MPEKGILMQGSNVRAILEGRKSQTRRVLKPQPDFEYDTQDPHIDVNELAAQYSPPEYAIGDMLYVREAHYQTDDGDYEHAVFAADEASVKEHIALIKGMQTRHEFATDEWAKRHLKLRPPIHMPKAFARIWLEVTGVKVERVGDISEADAKAEGCEPATSGYDYSPLTGERTAIKTYRTGFVYLWNSINEKRGYGWGDNPWVAAYSFKRIEK